MSDALRSGHDAPVAGRAAALAAWMFAGALIAAAPAALGPFVSNGPVCAMRAIAHVSCPTCGLTRAIGLLARGDVAASLALHPWAIALAVQLFAAWVLWGAWVAGWLRPRPDRWVPHAVAVNLLALGAIWIVRFVTGTLPSAG